MGQYPITVGVGTVTTPNAQIREGVFTVEPAKMTATATSYTREKGQPNPAFEVTYSAFRNRETAEVFTQQPVATCDADEQSPAGTYEIRVAGGEAQNYIFTYVSGTLTITDATGIESVEESTPTVHSYFDLQGRKVEKPKKGLYIKNNKKVVVR